MKKIRILWIGLIFVFALSSFSFSQTKQVELHAIVNDYVFCLEKLLTGDYTYHFTYHVDKKTGVITNIHWNVKDCNLVDSDGNKYQIIDTGSDNLGLNWELFNTLNAWNEQIGANIYYEIEDGFMDLPEVGEWPTEGRVPWIFKIIGNGEVFTYMSFLRGYFDEEGNLVLTVDRSRIECNW